jgi:hypothetical protein
LIGGISLPNARQTAALGNRKSIVFSFDLILYELLITETAILKDGSQQNLLEMAASESHREILESIALKVKELIGDCRGQNP